MGFASEMHVKILDSWDDFNEWCGGGSRGLLAVAALALLILALLAVVFVPGLMPTDDDEGVVAKETPTKPAAETEPTAAPTVAPPETVVLPDIPTPTTEPIPVEPPVTPARLPEIHTVVINPYVTQKFEFDPVNCTIAQNDSVVWLNEDTSTQGTYILTSDEDLWQPVNIPFSSEFTYTFNATGTYHYGCEYFPDMKGTIIVR